MNKPKWIVAVVSILILCSAGCAQREHHGFEPCDIQSDGPCGGPGPVTPASLAYLARILESKQLTDAARGADRAGNYAAEESYARQSLAQGAGTGFGQILLAQSLNDEGKTQEALIAYKALLKRGGMSAEDRLYYARLLLKTGQWAQAVSVYNRAILDIQDDELLRAHSNFTPTLPRPKDLAVDIHIGLGMECLHSSDWGAGSQDNKAMLNFHQALALAPNDPVANYQYGIALAQTRHVGEAQVALKKAASLGGDDIKKAAQRNLPAGAIYP